MKNTPTNAADDYINGLLVYIDAGGHPREEVDFDSLARALATDLGGHSSKPELAVIVRSAESLSQELAKTVQAQGKDDYILRAVRSRLAVIRLRLERVMVNDELAQDHENARLVLSESEAQLELRRSEMEQAIESGDEDVIRSLKIELEILPESIASAELELQDILIARAESQSIGIATAGEEAQADVDAAIAAHVKAIEAIKTTEQHAAKVMLDARMAIATASLAEIDLRELQDQREQMANKAADDRTKRLRMLAGLALTA